jgi:general secretion pathway protein N
VWSGSAVPVLTGGPGSRSAATLPGRLRWSLAWNDGAWEVQLRHPCCLRGVPRVRVSPDWPRLRVTLTPDPVVGAPPTAPGGGPAVGQWPAAWLAGLGTPWNTVQLDGLLRLSTPGLALERTRQGWRVEGRALLDAVELASRLSTLPTLGSYRLEVTGAGDDGVRLSLQTLSGALRLHADGGWLGGRLRLRGEAEAAHGAESALDNLLNLIGRRQGARSIIAIG